MLTEPVEVQKPVSEFDTEKTFKVLGSVVYRVEATLPDGTVKVVEGVKAYTKALELHPKGPNSFHIVIETDTKNRNSRARTIRYPYNFLHNSVLFTLKTYKMETMSSDEGQFKVFALNYNLLALPWNMCMIVHEMNGQLCYFWTSRSEWDRGEVNHRGEELQMFLKVPDERSVPISLTRGIFISEIGEWMDRCKAELVRKG